jgi:hypothetical protein
VAIARFSGAFQYLVPVRDLGFPVLPLGAMITLVSVRLCLAILHPALTLLQPIHGLNVESAQLILVVAAMRYQPPVHSIFSPLLVLVEPVVLLGLNDPVEVPRVSSLLHSENTDFGPTFRAISKP